MSFNQINSGVGAALLGQSVTSVLSDSTGFSSVAFDGQAGLVASKVVGRRKISLGGLPTEIPVYQFSSRGKRDIELWPCISYEIVGMQFNPKRYVWPGDQFRTPVKSSYVTYTQSDGTVIEGPSLREHRDHPDPWDFIVEIRTWSKVENSEESMAMQHLILETFPWHGGALSVMQLNGVPTTYEIYGQSINNVDNEEPELDNPLQREYSWVMTYMVEGFLDNTLATELKRTLLEPPIVEEEVI